MMIDDDDEALAATLDEIDAFLGGCWAARDRRRAQRTTIERLSRRRRQDRLRGLRAETLALEQRLTRAIDRERYPHSKSNGITRPSRVSNRASIAALAARHDRIEELRRQFRELVLQTKRMEDESTELRVRLRQSRQRFTRIQGLLEHSPRPEDLFDLSSATFEPLSMDEALDVVRDSLRTTAHLDTHEHQSSGMELLGWRDRYCVRGDAFCIDMTKRFLGREAEELMLRSWRVLSSPERICQDLGEPGQTWRAKVLQSLTDDIHIIHVHAFVHDTSESEHVVILLYRASIDDGFVVGYRDIPVPGFQCLLRHGDEWCPINSWTRFMPLRGEGGRVIGCEVTDGGEVERSKVLSIPTAVRRCLEAVMFWETLCAMSTLLPET